MSQPQLGEEGNYETISILFEQKTQKRNTASHNIKRQNFLSALINEKFTGISVMNARGIFWRKLIFHSLFISDLIHTASISIILLQTHFKYFLD